MNETVLNIVKEIFGKKELSEDIKKLINKLEKYVKAQDDLNAILSSLDDFVFELDEDGRFVNAWAADESKFFLPREQFIGKRIEEVIPSPLYEQLYEGFRRAKETRRVQQVEYSPPSSDQYFLARYNYLENHHVSVIIQDITEKRKAREELVEAKNQAESAAKAKLDFLSNISHELRTPMNAIVGLSDLLMEQNPEEGEMFEYLQSIKYSADNLLIIINDLLDFNKIEAGKIRFEQVDFDLYEELEKLSKSFEIKAMEKGISLSLDISTNVPRILKGDPHRLNQVLVNLIGNAIKFTNQGYVKISVTPKQENKETYMLGFKIEDSGIGIPYSKRHIIFESFTQAYSDTTRRFGGTGLGLAITQRLVNLKKGKIYLESTENKGTTFFVDLPFHKSDKKSIDIQEKNQTKKSLSGVKILVVEDNKMNQYVAKQILKNWNADVTIANNGKEALEILEEEFFDVVLMDIQMPEMNGYETTEWIRAMNPAIPIKDPEVPIIALTADAFVETKRLVLESGMNNFIVKPIQRDELYSKIMQQIR